MGDILDTIFRAYDIRGLAHTELSVERVANIGQALGSTIQEKGETQAIVGRDGRESSPELSAALIAGIVRSGCDVVDLGLVPTPVFYFATHVLNQRSGVMLTGSHNARPYNGLKIILQQKSLSTEQLLELRERVRRQSMLHDRGDVLHLDINDRYTNQVLHGLSLQKRLKVVVDASNGAASLLAPHVLEKVAEVVPLFCDVDGRFPNHDPDSSQPENYSALKKAVSEHQADLGIMFDGDADRLGVVTASGRIIWPDRLLMLFAQDILRDTPLAKIIYDVKCSEQLTEIIQSMGGQSIMWKTGHVHVKNKLAESGGLLAGEMSGHFFFKDRWYGFDDGLYAALRLLEILSKSALTLDELVDQWPTLVHTPELRIPVAEHEKFLLMEELLKKVPFLSNTVNTLDGVRVTFEHGWGLLRASNTSPYLILRFEANTQEMLLHIQQQFKMWINSVRVGLSIPF